MKVFSPLLTSALLLVSATGFADVATYEFTNNSDRDHKIILGTPKAFSSYSGKVTDFYVKEINLPKATKAKGRRRRLQATTERGQINVNTSRTTPLYVVIHESSSVRDDAKVHGSRSEHHLTLKCAIDASHRTNCTTSK
jgi:hypothetical protein